MERAIQVRQGKNYEQRLIISMRASEAIPSFSLFWNKKYTTEGNSRRKVKKEREKMREMT